MGLVLQGSSVQARQALIPFYEAETPDWYQTSSKILELPDGQVLLTYQGGTKIFDGGKWNDVHNLSGLNILSAEIYENEVWIGLDYDFGVLAPIHRGEFEFRSMKHLLPDTSGIQNQIVGITSAGGSLFINTYYNSYIWDGDELMVMSAREILSQAIGETSEEYPRIFLNMAFSVGDVYLQEVRPYGFLKFEESSFVVDSLYTPGLPKTVLFDLKKLKNGDLIAVSLAGLYRRKPDEGWEPYKTDIPDELLPDFFIQYQEYGNGNYIIQNERTAFFLNEQGNYLFNLNDIPGFSSNKGFLNLEITRDGVIWIPADESIIRLYPEMPIHKQDTDVYTQSEFGSPFLWQNYVVIITDVYESFRFRKRANGVGIQLDTLQVYPGGDGAVLGVEQQGESIFFFYSNMIQEYRNDTLYSESSLELPVSRYINLPDQDDFFLVSMRNGIGVLERSENKTWKQRMVYPNSDYSRISGIVTVADQEYIGVTGNGEIFRVTVTDSIPVVTPLISLGDRFGISKVDEIVKVNNEIIIFSDKGAFFSVNGNTESWSKGAGILDGIPESMHVFGALKHNESVYLYGRDNWGASLWKFENGILSSLPLGGLDQVFYMSVDPEGLLWLNTGSQTVWVDQEELIHWYDSKETLLSNWVEGSSIKQTNSGSGWHELPYDYEAFVLHTGFNNNFFPKKNRFRIRINDKVWGVWQPGSRFDLSFLAPGNYEIEVHGINGLGQLHTSKPVLIKINAPWYLSRKAIISYFFLLVLTLWWIVLRAVSYRTRSLELNFKAKQVDELRKMDEMKNRLLMNISHELKTPLTLTLAPLEQLRDELVSGEGKWEKPYDLVARNGERLKELVNQVIDLARLDSDNLTLNFEYINANDFFGLVVQSFESLAAKKNLSIAFSSETEDVMVVLDRDKMQKVLTNLISNAIKFTPDQGEIFVTLTPNDEFLTVTVSDTGFGIEPERIPLIFDRFHTNNEKTTGSGDGIGVGLSICREFVLLHGGDIEVESEIDKGTTFKVKIPYNLDKAIENITGFKEEESPAGLVSYESDDSVIKTIPPSVNPGSEVLLLEDNEDMRVYISSVLSRQGYHVIQKESGEQGLKQLVNRTPDIIITDLMMPGMDGLEFMKKVRGNIEFRGIPIIILTALSGSNEKMLAFELGVSDYILKPFHEKELLVRVSNLISLKKEREETFRDDISPAEKSTDQNFTGKLRQFVIDNLDNTNLKTDDLSNAVNMSRRHFFRAIKAETGFTPAEFIKEVRMFEARKMLQNQKNITISETSYAIGISTPSYFVKLYKEHFGVHPKEHTI